MLKIFLGNHYNFWLFISILLTCFWVSVSVRYHQFETWKKTPTTYFVGDRPLMTTLDAPYWLRLAREYNQGTLEQLDRLRSYPEGSVNFKDKQASIPKKFKNPPLLSSPSQTQSQNRLNQGKNYRDIPLISFLIAHLSTFFDHNYFLTGTLIIPVFASLFIIPIGILLFRIGFPVSGLLGGLIATFAAAYYMRTSIGRIDTDMLNLFFPSLAALLVFLASYSKSDRSILLYSIGTGLSLFFFQWWYSKPGFTIVYFIILVFCLFIQKIRFLTIILSAFLFVLCAHPETFVKGTNNIEIFLQNYILLDQTESRADNGNGKIPAIFPNVLTTISEVEKFSFDRVLGNILNNSIFGITGLIAFLCFIVYRWRALLPLFPMLALGLLSFHSSNRFTMYLAPFIGIGLGWMLQIVIESVFHLIAKFFGLKKVREIKGEGNKGKESAWQISDIDWFAWARQVILYLVMGVLFWLISGQTAISYVPGPSIHARVYETFFKVKEQVPENSALLTWWDYGYAITDATGLATFHDGSSQNSPKTFFVAKSLISSAQDELYQFSQFLSTAGNHGIAKNNSSPEALLKAVRNPEHKPWDPIYLFFTADMTGKYGAISKLGSWDIKKGGSKPRVYQNLECNKITNKEINCRGAKIDLKAGFINNQLALRRIIFIRNGKVLREQKFTHDQGFTIQLIVVGKNIVQVQLIDETVFSSNFNQMFLLGQYREDLFEEVYNAFPFSRLYRFKY